jgi:hypothetical protein
MGVSFRLQRFFGFFDGGLKGAHRLRPHLVEVGTQAGDTFRVELVQTAGAGPSVGHKTGLLEDFEMLRYGWARNGQGAGQLIDGKGTGGELLKDRHAGGIAQGFKAGL